MMRMLVILKTVTKDGALLPILQQVRLGPAKMILEWFTGEQVHSVNPESLVSVKISLYPSYYGNNDRDTGDVIVHEPYDTHSMITKVGS